MPDIAILIKEAEILLKKTPYDLSHDLSHHQRVWENALIISKNVSEPVDIKVLQVACFWHDVTIGKKDQTENRRPHVEEMFAHLKILMTRHKFDQNFQEAVIQTISDHEFSTKKQNSIEAKILFDADKLDAFHKKRYTDLLNAFKAKKLSRAKIFLIVQAAKLWLKTVRSRYHFDVSKEIHDRRIDILLNDDEAVETAKEFGIDIAKLVR